MYPPVTVKCSNNNCQKSFSAHPPEVPSKPVKYKSDESPLPTVEKIRQCPYCGTSATVTFKPC